MRRTAHLVPWRRSPAAPKLPDLSASASGRPSAAASAGTPGSISGPMARASSDERRDDGARGLAAGDDEAPHAVVDEPRRGLGEERVEGRRDRLAPMRAPGACGPRRARPRNRSAAPRRRARARRRQALPASTAPSMTASTSTCSTGCPARWTSICASVAFEQEPARTASAPSTPWKALPLPVARPWRMKLRGSPSAMPEPPVRSGASAQASPIAKRSSSEIASTMTSRSPRAAAPSSAWRSAAPPRLTTGHGTSPTGACDWRASQRRRSGSVIGLSGMVLEAGFVEEPVADEEMALVDGAAGGRERRAGQRRPLTPSARASASPTGPMLPCGVEFEGRAVLEHELPAALRPQPLEAPRARARPRRPPRSSGSSARRRRPRRSRAPASSAGRGTARSRARPWPACWRCRSRR